MAKFKLGCCLLCFKGRIADTRMTSNTRRVYKESREGGARLKWDGINVEQSFLG